MLAAEARAESGLTLRARESIRKRMTNRSLPKADCDILRPTTDDSLDLGAGCVSELPHQQHPKRCLPRGSKEQLQRMGRGREGGGTSGTRRENGQSGEGRDSAACLHRFCSG